jgi:arsenate reductase
MEAKTYNVLFICTGNSARSIIAEGLMNQLGKGRFKAYSAGSHPKGEVHPLALHVLGKNDIDVSGFRSKSWDEFGQPNSPAFDFVFTVCDKAAGEVCPAWPGQPITAHWGMPDPAAVQGNAFAQESAFLETMVHMRRRIQLFLALPLTSLDRMAIQREVRDIGTR